MARVVIIGAGLTGISTAYHLEQNGFFDYELYEKERTVGGLCRSTQHDGFTFDFTGHLLHASDPYFYGLIKSIVGLENMNVIDRRSFIFSHDTYTKYPFQINLFGLPPDIIVECITGFIKRTKNPTPHNFKEWVQSHFGEGFGKHFFYPYQEKIFAHPIEKITASWTGRFVPATSLEQVLYGSLSDHKDAVGYNARFLYPKKGGIQQWVHKLADNITKPINTNCCVESIDIAHKTVSFSNGHHEPYEMLINTMPLDRLLSLVHEPASLSVTTALAYLKCNKVVNFNLGVNRPNLSKKHWIYFPEQKYPFYRLGFWHNFSEHMAPADHSALYGEFAYMQQSKEWVHQQLSESIKEVKRLFSISDQEIVTEKVFHIEHAYVTYDHWREEHLASLLKRLEEQSISSIGRYGAWKYSSMQEAVLDGKEAAENIVKEMNKPLSSSATTTPEISYE